MSKKKLYILHENGAPRHFEAIGFLNIEKEHYDKIISLEFSLIRQFGKGIIRRKLKVLKKALINLIYLIYFLFTKNKQIIIGAAPYDLFIFYLIMLKKRHNVIYYSSWPYWDYSRYPKKVISKFQIMVWEKFLSNVKIVGVTKAVESGLRQYSNDITVIPHCINENIFFPRVEKDSSKFTIIYVGRLIPEKGVEFIIEMIEEFSNYSDIEWRFVGEGSLSDKIIELQNNNSSVKYYGKVSNQTDLSLIYSECNVLILPSIPTAQWEELFGIVLIEAMACGVVPISTNCIGPLTIIEDNENGFITPYTDMRTIIDKIEVLYNNRGLLEKMSMKAKSEALNNYTISNTSQLWEKVLE